MNTTYAEKAARILQDNRPVEYNVPDSTYIVYNEFMVKTGRKYDKVFRHEQGYFDGEPAGQSTKLELFVEKETGNILKPNGNQPAKGVRYILSDEEGCEEFAEACKVKTYLYDRGYGKRVIKR